MELNVSETKCCTLSDTTEASVMNMVAGLDIQACPLDWDTFYIHACHFKCKVWHFGKIYLLSFLVRFLSERQMRKWTDKTTDSSWLALAALAPFCGGTATENGCKLGRQREVWGLLSCHTRRRSCWLTSHVSFASRMLACYNNIMPL